MILLIPYVYKMFCTEVVVLPQQCSASLVLCVSILHPYTSQQRPFFMNVFFLVENSNSVFKSIEPLIDAMLFMGLLYPRLFLQ